MLNILWNIKENPFIRRQHKLTPSSLSYYLPEIPTSLKKQSRFYRETAGDSMNVRIYPPARMRCDTCNTYTICIWRDRQTDSQAAENLTECIYSYQIAYTYTLSATHLLAESASSMNGRRNLKSCSFHTHIPARIEQPGTRKYCRATSNGKTDSSSLGKKNEHRHYRKG